MEEILAGLLIFIQGFAVLNSGSENHLVIPSANPQASVSQTASAPAPEIKSAGPTPLPFSSKKNKLKPAVKAISISVFSVSEVLQALNDYRGKNGVGGLSLDPVLQEYAQSRVNYLKVLGKLDKHAGHQEFMKNNGFGKLGFNAVAENQSWNYRGDAQGLVERFYGKSSGHNKNQLNPEYTHVGIGINGVFTNLVFGGRKG